MRWRYRSSLMARPSTFAMYSAIKIDAMTKISAKNVRLSNAYSIDISRGDRKRLAAIRIIKIPVIASGAYFQLRYTVRNKGMRYRIQIITPRGVTMSMMNMNSVAMAIYAIIRVKSSRRINGQVSLVVSDIPEDLKTLYKKLVIEKLWLFFEKS
jgi:hypothetical protein